MAALSLRLPESLHHAAREVALQDGLSLNQLVMTALAEKMADLKTADDLAQRAQGADEKIGTQSSLKFPTYHPTALRRKKGGQTKKGPWAHCPRTFP